MRRKSEKRQRERVVSVRMTTAEHVRAQQLAAMSGLTLGAYMRARALTQRAPQLAFGVLHRGEGQYPAPVNSAGPIIPGGVQ